MAKTPEEEWSDLVADWDKKHKAALGFQLFDLGTLQPDRVPEYERLNSESDDARMRMDKFIAAALAGLKS